MDGRDIGAKQSFVASPGHDGERNLFSRINLFLAVQPILQKYLRSSSTQITSEIPAFRPKEGRIAIVTNAGRDAVDADGAADEQRSSADGEVVWS